MSNRSRLAASLRPAALALAIVAPAASASLAADLTNTASNFRDAYGRPLNPETGTTIPGTPNNGG